MDHPGWFGGWRWLWGIGYAALLGAVVWAMFAARETALTTLSTHQAVADWEAWRADVRADQDRPAPVQRRVPKSAEPPAVVLMREHFAVMLAGAIFFSSLLFWIIAWLVTGMLRSATDGARQDAAAMSDPPAS